MGVLLFESVYSVFILEAFTVDTEQKTVNERTKRKAGTDAVSTAQTIKGTRTGASYIKTIGVLSIGQIRTMLTENTLREERRKRVGR